MCITLQICGRLHWPGTNFSDYGILSTRKFTGGTPIKRSWNSIWSETFWTKWLCVANQLILKITVKDILEEEEMTLDWNFKWGWFHSKPFLKYYFQIEFWFYQCTTLLSCGFCTNCNLMSCVLLKNYHVLVDQESRILVSPRCETLLSGQIARYSLIVMCCVPQVLVDCCVHQVLVDQRHRQRSQLHPQLWAAVPRKPQVLKLCRWRKVSTIILSSTILFGGLHIFVYLSQKM